MSLINYFNSLSFDVKNISKYTVFAVIEKSFPFFLLPVLTRWLSEIEMGYYILFISCSAFLLPLIKIGIDSLTTIKFFKPKSDFKKFIFESTFVFVLWNLALSILIILFNKVFSLFFEIPSNLFVLIYLVLLPSFFNTQLLVYFRVNNLVNKYGYFSLSQSFFKNLCILIFLILFNKDVETILYAYLTSNLLFSFFSINYLIKKGFLSISFLTKINLSLVRDMLKIVFNQLLFWVGGSYSKVIIAQRIDLKSTGGFGVASTFVLPVSLLHEAFNKAYSPYLFEKLKSDDSKSKKEIVKFTYKYYLFLFSVCFVISLFGYAFFDIIFGKIYEKYVVYIPFLVFASFFNGLYKVHIAYLYFEEKFNVINYISIVTNFSIIIMILISIDTFGLLGVSVSYLFGQLISYILAFYLSSKYKKMPWI